MLVWIEYIVHKYIQNMGSRSKPKASLFPDKLPIRILTQSMSHQTKAKAIQRIVATQINSSFSPPLHLHKALKSFDPTMSIRLKSPNVKSILDVPIRTNSPSPADKKQIWPMTQIYLVFFFCKTYHWFWWQRILFYLAPSGDSHVLISDAWAF